MAEWKVTCADILDWAKTYSGPKFHALLADPSYALSKRKPIDLSAPAYLPAGATVGDVIAAYHAIQQWGSRGFMGRTFDTDVAFNPEVWRALAQHLHNGAFGMAFASSRGWHRLATAIEDGGLEIHPAIFNWRTGEIVRVPALLGWACGQGWPKATRIDTQIDKMEGLKPKYIGERWPGRRTEGSGAGFGDTCYGTFKRGCPITEPATELGRVWEGYRYGRQALKPALEPIVLFQKPYGGPALERITATGAGALWIDGGRIACAEGDRTDRKGGNVPKWGHATYADDEYSASAMADSPAHPAGRWPANLTLTHHPACRPIGTKQIRADGGPTGRPLARKRGVTYNPGARRSTVDHRVDGKEAVQIWECHEDCPARRLGEQSGERPSTGGTGPNKGSLGGDGIYQGGQPWRYFHYKDHGTAARFFHQADWTWECHEDCPARRLGEQSGVSISRSASGVRRHGRSGGIMGDIGGLRDGRPEGHDDHGTAARFFHQADWTWECHEDCPARRLGEQSGDQCGAAAPVRGNEPSTPAKNVYGKYSRGGGVFYGDIGTAARFFHCPDWALETALQIASADPAHYCAKAHRSERDAGLSAFFWKKDRSRPIGYARIKRAAWVKLPKKRRRRGNVHPTIKPISLTTWLARLLLPPEEYAPRRLLVPFCGTGSELIGGALAGWEQIEGIELLAVNTEMAMARLRWWHIWGADRGLSEPRQIIQGYRKVRGQGHREAEPSGSPETRPVARQLSLFD